MKPANRFEMIADPTVLETLKLAETPGIISFAGGMPAPETMASELVNQALKKTAINLQYSPAAGVSALRQTAARRLSKQWKRQIISEEILITSGSQQALDLIAKVYFNPGDTVLVEDPTYFVALSAFNAYQPNYKIINSQNPRKWPKGKFAYLVPTFQNPSGETIDVSRRKAIAAAIKKSGVLLIEDDPYRELYFHQAPPLPIAALAPKNTIYITSLSKIIGPAMRIGIVRAAPGVIRKLAVAKTGMDLCSSGWLQVLANHVLNNPAMKKHLETIKGYYAKKAAIMLNCLKTEMPPGVTWTKPEGGLFIWMSLPEYVDTKALSKKAVDAGVAFVPGYVFSPSNSSSNSLRICYSLPDEKQIRIGISILAGVIRSTLK